MEKDLAAYVASMQQIELACEKLKQIGDLPGLEHLESLKSKVLEFYGAPSKEGAQDIMDYLTGLKMNLSTAGDRQQSLFKRTIVVDGQNTSLDQIGEDLLDLLKEPGI